MRHSIGVAHLAGHDTANSTLVQTQFDLQLDDARAVVEQEVEVREPVRDGHLTEQLGVLTLRLEVLGRRQQERIRGSASVAGSQPRW